MDAVTGRTAEVAVDVEDGLRVARALCAAGDRVLVFGSFLTVGPALASLGAEA
jgi:folylpolyglutamate synthase/dihydropteroate synthase